MTKRFFLCAFVLQGLLAIAQNAEVPLTIGQAQQTFLRNNFLLLAKRYDITAAEAQILQSKLYPNPELSIDLVGYDGENHRYLPLGANGQAAGEIDQLILMGGKRKARIDLAKLDKQRAEADLADLTRNLQYDLREAFFTVYHQQQLIDKYNVLLDELGTLIDRYQVQVGKGNIPLKDLVRLKSVYAKISNDKSEESQTLTQQQQKLNLLLGTDDNIVAVFPKADADKTASTLLSYDDLLAKALDRPDANLAKTDLEAANKNLTLQKRNAIPDLTLSAGYSQRGEAYLHQVSLGLGFPIPFFDTNKGNIRSARVDADKAKGEVDYKQAEIKADVRAAYENFIRSVEEYRRINKMVDQDFQTVFNGVDTNFRKGNVSMIEFADFIESYNDTQAEVERVKLQLALAAARIDLVTGTQNF
jgi:cobalt-zinc-cadmium efflux system outer membrane protein